MASLFFGISTGLCGFGAYSCFSNFSREYEKSLNFKNKLERYVLNFSDKSFLVGENGIINFSLVSPNYFYSVSKLISEKDVSLRSYEKYNLYTGKTTRIIVPVEVENTLKKCIDKFLSDPTFGEQCKPSSDISYLFSTRPSKAQCDGKYLTDLLHERHGIRTMYGGNMDIFELSTTKLNSQIFLYGKNVGEKFEYSVVSDNKKQLINKIVSESDESGPYFFGGLVFTSGFVFCLVSVLTEVGTK